VKKVIAILLCLSVLTVNGSAVMAAPLLAGSDPGSAIPLEHGLNEGTLEAGMEVWYKFSLPKRGDTMVGYMNLTLIHAPAGWKITDNVGFEIYTTEQLGFRAAGDRFINTGASEIVSRDANDETGEHIWAGDLMRGIDYYLRVHNDSEAKVAYKLFDEDVIHVDFGPTQMPETGTTAAPAGSNPTVALKLEEGVNEGSLKAGTEKWYTFVQPKKADSSTDAVALTLINIPGGWQITDNVGFQVFTIRTLGYWAWGDKDVNTGAGTTYERDGDPNTGEHLWVGDVMRGEIYYVRVYNNSASDIGYKLYTEDIIHGQYGPQPVAAKAAPPGAPGSSPEVALTLEEGVNEGLLEAGKDEWYTLVRPKKAGSSTDYVALTLVNAPGGWQITDNVGFQVFTIRTLGYWAWGDKDVNTGIGTTYERDGDPNTGEHLWAGDMMRGEIYYVRVYNNSASDIGYKLYTRDVIHSLFGPPPPTPKAAPPGAPGSSPEVALTLEEGVNEGLLEAGEDEWYTFVRPKKAGSSTDYMPLTLVNVPGGWQITDNVGFQVFTIRTLGYWAWGDENVNTGAGTTYERDGDPNTGEHLWVGDVMRGEIYYVRVYNNSASDIGYKLYTRDIIHSQFGPPPPVPEAAPADPGSNPAVALKLVMTTKEDYTSDTLSAGESRWYTFRPKLGAGDTAYMELTLIHVPGGWQITDRVGFQLFTADKLALWARGDKLVNTGAGAIVERDGDANTGEHFWAGYLLRDMDYYLQLFNDSDADIEYRLYQGDVVHTDIGR
jgi:uncharacterized protein YegJ (DUF2314 family)